MAKSKIRYAVIGLGNIAQVAILPGFANTNNSELVALVTSDETKRTELAGRYDVEHAGHYDDLERILKDSRADAVFIALPNHLHRQYTERSARAGVHVLCEKPMADSEEDCQAMMRATREAGVKLMIAYRLHFEAANLRAIELIEDGRIGEPRLFWGTLTHQVAAGNIRTRPEAGGGVLLDAGVYPINAARYLFRAEPIEAFAYAFGDGFDVDQTTVATLRFPGDRIAQFAVSQEAASVSAYRVIGTKGDIALDPAFQYAKPSTLTVTTDEKPQEEKFPKHDQFGAEIEYFSRCILDDQEPEPSGEEGLADVRICRAILQSADARRPIAIERVSRRRRPEPDQRIDKPGIKEPETVHAPPPEG